ncbi:hypothetical protein LY78DRAFT_656917, partial [Colletotrichum sublineola]
MHPAQARPRRPGRPQRQQRTKRSQSWLRGATIPTTQLAQNLQSHERPLYETIDWGAPIQDPPIQDPPLPPTLESLHSSTSTQNALGQDISTCDHYSRDIVRDIVSTIAKIHKDDEEHHKAIISQCNRVESEIDAFINDIKHAAALEPIVGGTAEEGHHGP